MLNLVVLDVLDHSGQLRSRLPEELRHRIQGTQSRCKEEQLLWSKSLSPLLVLRARYRHHSTSQPLFHYLPRASITPISREPNEPDFSYGQALGSLRAPDDIRNTVAIILPFDLTSYTALESTSNRYDPPPSYATRIRTLLSTDVIRREERVERADSRSLYRVAL